VITGSLPAGSGAFETMRVYRGTPFAWRRHVERLDAAARALGLASPDARHLRDAVDAVLQENGFVDARVRVTLVGAPGVRDPDMIVAASRLAASRPSTSVVVASWPRNERAATVGVKSTSYAENARAFADARDRGADEAVFANTLGQLCEATGSNVFVVDRGTVRTPPASAGCLLGVTRALVLELCTAHGIPVEEVGLAFSTLADADEAFLTSTTREVQAISAIDGRPRASAHTPGPVTTRLASLFRDLVARDLDP
jgi:branched-chain amino acid aminotransferase